MSRTKRVIAIVGAVVLTLAIAVVAVFAGGAQGGSAASKSTTAAVPAADQQAVGAAVAGDNAGMLEMMAFGAPGQGGDRLAQCQSFVSGLATNLNIQPAALGAAVKKTMIQQIDAAQTAGKLTADQAQQAKDRVNAANDADICASMNGAGGISGAGGSSKGGVGHGMGGALQGDMLNAAASYFGITSDVLKQELQDKGTLQAVAAAHGKDNAAGKAGLQAALESALRTSLTNKGMSADQVTQAVTIFNQQFDQFYTMPIGQRGMPGGPGKRMPGASPAPSATPQTR